MEIGYDFSLIFPSTPIQKLDRPALVRLNPRKYWAVQKAVDAMGERSTDAQGLKRVLTSYQKMLDSEDEQSLYLMWHKHATKENVSVVVGLLKIGRKRLYLLDESGSQQFEEKPVCILDFYVHESMQRMGNGHALFDYMLSSESISAWTVAIDRPSEAFLQFLHKYYQLERPIWQSTNYVVFPAFFEDKKTITRNDAGSGGDRRGARSQKYPTTATPEEAKPQQQVARSARASSRGDSAGGIIHGGGATNARKEAGPDTPLGRKNARDFGHQSIW